MQAASYDVLRLRTVLCRHCCCLCRQRGRLIFSSDSSVITCCRGALFVEFFLSVRAEFTNRQHPRPHGWTRAACSGSYTQCGSSVATCSQVLYGVGPWE
jgi:hypothetical protein